MLQRKQMTYAVSERRHAQCLHFASREISSTYLHCANKKTQLLKFNYWISSRYSKWSWLGTGLQPACVHQSQLSKVRAYEREGTTRSSCYSSSSSMCGAALHITDEQCSSVIRSTGSSDTTPHCKAALNKVCSQETISCLSVCQSTGANLFTITTFISQTFSLIIGTNARKLGLSWFKILIFSQIWPNMQDSVSRRGFLLRSFMI